MFTSIVPSTFSSSLTKRPENPILKFSVTPPFLASPASSNFSSIMGNFCCTMKQDPNQEEIHQSPPWKTGVDNVQHSNKESFASSLQTINANASATQVVTASHDQRENPDQDVRESIACLAARKDQRPLSRVDKKSSGQVGAYKLNSFCYKVLKEATQNFSEENFIGEGGFGDVYKGYIKFCNSNSAKPSNGGLTIAVKKLRRNSPQGHHEWLNEIGFLSTLNHHNIVDLLGFCEKGDNRILVYEYMRNGSLADHISEENVSAALTWTRRMKIAVGMAKGLEYLHTCKIIHRDFKASNVLLDDDFNPKVSDFGLARFGPDGSKTHVTTTVLGTKGYFAPEYIATGHLTLKTDVYSFGVVLLEILSGSGAVKKHPNGETEELANWGKPYLNNREELHQVIDKKLERQISIEQAQGFTDIILKCLRSNPKLRPTMTTVLSDLEKLQNAARYPTARLYYSRACSFNRHQSKKDPS